MEIRINNLYGGLADSVFENIQSGTFQLASDLEVFKFSNLLKPTIGLISQSFTSPTVTGGKFKMAVTPSNSTTYFFGTNGSNLLDIYSGGLGNVNLTSVGTATAGNNNGYLDRLWADELGGYLLFWTNSAGNIGRITLSNNTFAENPYTFTPANSFLGPIKAHDGLGKIFFAAGNKVYYHDTTTVAGTADPTLGLTLDPKYIIRSLTTWGRFVLIGASVSNGTSTIETDASKIFVWDGAALTVDDVVDIGDVGLRAIRNINGVIHILTIAAPSGDYGRNAVRIYTSTGGPATLQKELPLNNTNTFSSSPSGLIIYDTAVDVNQGKLYFTLSAYTDGNSTGGVGITQGIYAFGSANNSRSFLTLYKTIPNVAADEVIPFLRFNKSNLVIAHQLFAQTTHYIHHDVATYVTSQGKYRSNAFPLNDGKKGKIKSIKIMHKPLVASCGFTVKVKHFGHYPKDGSVPTEDSFTTVYGPQGNSTTSGMSQSTTNTTYTILSDLDTFKVADLAQIEIDFDEVSAGNSAEILFDIIIETIPIET